MKNAIILILIFLAFVKFPTIALAAVGTLATTVLLAMFGVVNFKIQYNADENV